VTDLFYLFHYKQELDYFFCSTDLFVDRDKHLNCRRIHCQQKVIRRSTRPATSQGGNEHNCSFQSNWIKQKRAKGQRFSWWTISTLSGPELSSHLAPSRLMFSLDKRSKLVQNKYYIYGDHNRVCIQASWIHKSDNNLVCILLAWRQP